MTVKIMWLHSHITNASGSSKFLYNILKQLSTKYKITLFLQKPITFLNDEFKKLPIEIIIISNYSTTDWKFWLNFSSEIEKQKSVLKNYHDNFDLIISSFFPMNILATDLNLKHIQFCFQPYAFFWDNELINSLPFFKKIFLKYFKKQFSKLDISATQNSDILLTINNGSKNSIQKIYKKESIPTNMGIDVTKTESIKKLLNLQSSTILIHSTDWSPLKNTVWLIEQFIEIQKRFPNTVLIITETKTDSSEKNKALKLVQNNNLTNVKFLGTLPKLEYEKYLSSSDIVIYSGFGSGITTSLFVLECMALGIPPLISEQASEDVIHEKTGYLFKNSNEFQKFLTNLLEDDSLRINLGNSAQKFILEKHSWMNVSEIFEKQISLILKK